MEALTPPGGRPWWPALAALAALWILAVRQFRFEWSINPQYNYGWVVPFLALYLFIERWRRRPPAQTPGARVPLAVLVILCATVLFPLRLAQEAGPDWRLLGWIHGAACVALTLALIYRAGGAAWLRHFAFAVAFFFIAVPWPVPLEQSLVQRLMRSVTTICVEALSWVEIPAIQKGNIIEISNGRVGVEEACSGVRSLQTTLMIALFMGELLRFGVFRRIVLLIGGLAVAFVCNAARAYFLVWVSAKQGTDAVAKWHDNVGMTVLFGCLAGVGILCWILKPRAAQEPAAAPDPGLLRAGEPPGRGVLIAFSAWLLVVEGGTEAWYRAAEARAPKSQTWSITWPTAEKNYSESGFGDEVRSTLRYTDARYAKWSDAAGLRWEMFLLRWAPGRTSVQVARSHGPEVCLTSSGAVMTADLGLRPMRINGVDLAMRSYTFRARDRILHVFYCLWEQRPDSAEMSSAFQELTVARRIESVRKGIRNAGQQAIEVAVSGVAGPAEAEAAVRRFLETAVKP